MKRFILGLALTSLLSVPAYAMEEMSTSAMNNVTGQAGVTIGLDHLTLTTTSADTAWGDTDTNGGTIVMEKTGSETMNITGVIKIDAGTSTDVIQDSGSTVNLVPKDTSYIKIAMPDLKLDKTASSSMTTISLTDSQFGKGVAPTASTLGSYDAALTNTLGVSYSSGGNTSISANAIYIYAH